MFSVRPFSELYQLMMTYVETSVPTLEAEMSLCRNLHFKRMRDHLPFWQRASGPSIPKKWRLARSKGDTNCGVRPIRLTLLRLAATEGFGSILSTLRDRGYKDWLILMILATRRWMPGPRYRWGKALVLPNLAKRYTDFLTRTKTVADPIVDASLLDPETIEVQRSVAMFAIAQSWGLRVRQITPDV